MLPRSIPASLNNSYIYMYMKKLQGHACGIFTKLREIVILLIPNCPTVMILTHGGAEKTRVSFKTFIVEA